jgi:uncharacterized protein (DUF2336 family)
LCALPSSFPLHYRASVAGLPDFSKHNIPKRGKLHQIDTKLPNDRKMFQIAVI